MTCLFRRQPAMIFCLALLLTLLPVHTLLAQATTGTIVGVVTDPSGAAVPNATVILKNTSTGIARTIKTDGAGRYTASALGIGTYQVTATAPTFKTTSLGNVTLDINQTRTADLSLALGAATDEISVEAQAITTDTETSSNGQVLGQEQVAELPLANRQFYNLVEVAPGVTPPAQNSSMGFRGGMNVNGSPETANMFIINGTDNIDISTNQAVFRPSVDTIAEFKVLSGGYGADYGRMQGGQINIVTKSGTNKFHGSLYEYIRNGAIEARPWSPSAAVAGSKAPAFKQNTFGGTVGGPILKDKAFFFFGYEGQRIRQQITATSTVPTQWQQDGCSPTALTDPTTGVALPKVTETAGQGPCSEAPGGSGYDATTLSTWNSPSAVLGRQLLSLVYPVANTNIPVTNVTPSNDYLFNETRKETMDEYNSRIDYTLSSKDSLNGTFNHYHDPSFEPNNSLCSSRTLPKFGCYTDQITWLANIAETHLFSASLLNSFTFGWNRLQQPRIQEDNTAIGSAWGGLPNQLPSNAVSNNYGTPSVSEASGYTATGGQTNLPQNRWDNSFDIDEALTWTHKEHTYKAGVQALIVKTTEYEVTTGRGSLTFNPSTLQTANSKATLAGGLPAYASCAVATACGTSGDTIVDTQLGLPSSDSVTPTAPNIYDRYNSFDFYVMDDWKIKPYLTLNLGLRYEVDMPESEKYGAIATFSPSVANPLLSSGATAATVAPLAVGQTAGAGGVGNNGAFLTAAQTGQKALSTTDRNNFAPRVGFAWQPLHNDKTVIKGAYGIYFAEPQAFNEYLGFSTQYPVRYPKTFTPTAYNTGGSINLANPFPNELPLPGTPYCLTGTAGCNAPAVGTTCGNPCGLTPVVSGTEVNPHYSTPYVSQWTLGIQRQVTKSILAEALYFGNKGTKIAFGCTSTLNGNAHPDANALGQNYTAGSTNIVTIANGAAVTTATPSYSAVASGNLQLLRNYPNWGAISFHTTGCNSEYESLQSRVQVTTKRGLSVLVTYTYAKAEDGLQAAQDPAKAGFDRELSAFNIKHRLVISPVIALPFGKGQPFLNSGLGSAILGGFKVSGIYQYFTGRPFATTDSSQESSSSVSNDRPSLIVGQSLTGADSLGVGAVHNKNEWFNVHSLAYNPPGTFGSLAPNTLEGPGWDELDLTLGRTFPIKELAKAEFKVDAFNLLNHPNLYNPLTTTYAGSTTFLQSQGRGQPTQPGYCPVGYVPPSVTVNGKTTSATPVINGVPCTQGGGAANAGSFGTITQANGMREIQASLHITF